MRKLSEDLARRRLASAFGHAQSFSENFDEDTFVLYNPNTRQSISTASTAIVAERISRGWDCVGRYVSGKLVEVK